MTREHETQLKLPVPLDGKESGPQATVMGPPAGSFHLSGLESLTLLQHLTLRNDADSDDHRQVVGGLSRHEDSTYRRGRRHGS